MTPQAAQSLLEANFAPWVLALDLTVSAIDSEHALIRMPLSDQLARAGGIVSGQAVSGQALAALADTTMVLATIAHGGEFRPLATTNLDTQFLRPGTGTAILCRAEVVRAGKALVFARAEMRAETSGKIVATATATYFMP